MLEIIIITIILIMDRYTKYLSVKYLKDIKTKEVLKGVFSFTYVENRGAAFGILQNHRWVFIILTIIISIGIIYFLIYESNINIILRISLAMILGGAIGNLIDRIIYGYVVDMLHFTLIDYPVFNVADSFVVIGTILFAIYILFISDKLGKEIV